MITLRLHVNRLHHLTIQGGKLCHQATKMELVYMYVFVEEARNKVPIVLSRELEPMGPRAEIIA